MSENPVNRDRSRHVDVKFHFLRERVRAGEIKLYKCWSPLNVADALTKSLPRPAFHKHAPFMHGTRSSYRPFTDLVPRSSFLFIFPVSCTSSPDKFVVFSFPFSTIFFSVR